MDAIDGWKDGWKEQRKKKGNSAQNRWVERNLYGAVLYIIVEYAYIYIYARIDVYE